MLAQSLLTTYGTEFALLDRTWNSTNSHVLCGRQNSSTARHEATLTRPPGWRRSCLMGPIPTDATGTGRRETVTDSRNLEPVTAKRKNAPDPPKGSGAMV
jgi:hypothetical protein